MTYTGPPTWATGDTPTAPDVNRWELGGAYIPLRAFDGATDDDKLTAFMAYAGAQTHSGIACVLDENRVYSFSQTRTVYDGFTLVSPFLTNGDQDRSSHPNAFAVNLSSNGGWLTCNGAIVFGVILSGLTFNCSSSTYVVEASGTPWLWRLNDIGFQNGAGLVGDSTHSVGVDMLNMTGVWNINNIRKCGFNLGGSDGQLSPANMNLDSPGNSEMSDSDYLARFTSLTFFTVANWFATCDRHSGLLMSGSNMSGLFMRNCVWQGRNKDTPCFGALIRINGGTLNMQQCHLDYAMTSPSTLGHGDKGYVHVASGGILQASNCMSNFATGQDGTQPVVYVEVGGYAQIRNWMGFLGNGGQRVKPVVQQAAAGLIDADTSVTVVTAA